MPVTQAFTASRNAAWSPTLVYPYQGAQLPPIGHIDMELRLYEGQPGDAKLRLAAIPYTDTLFSGTAGQPDEIRRLALSPIVTPAQLGQLPAGEPSGDPRVADTITFAFDILITYFDALSEPLSSGTFSLESGVTAA